MWHHNKVTVGLITKNNGTTIRNVIEDAFFTGFVDEVVVADIGSKDRTVSEVSYTKSRVLTSRDYKDAFNQIIEKSEGSLVIFADPNGYIPGTEVSKLLPYSLDCNAVFTSRLYWLGNEDFSKGKKFWNKNIKLGKKISSQLETVIFNDVNSMLFLLNKKALRHEGFRYLMKKEFFVFETMINVLQQGISHIQIPCEFHSSLESTDSELFSSFVDYHKMKKLISLLNKSPGKRVMINKYLTNEEREKAKESDSEHIDPILIKKRIAQMRKKLGIADNSTISLEVKKELEKAVKNVSKSTSTGKKRLTIQEELEKLKKLEAGLKSKSYKKE